MVNVKIYGAGSIGNHLAYACRQEGWKVTVCDLDDQALKRMKEDIYPSRYGTWDSEIDLLTGNESEQSEAYDLVIIGTPPDTHMDIALQVLQSCPPKALLIEKPLCTPALEGCDDLWRLSREKDVFVGVGYNHTLTENTQRAADMLKEKDIGTPLTISARFREHWGGIFKAHPWLRGPEDTYLGFSERGGGASGEHSHAINIWQHFAHLVGAGRIVEVSAMMDMVEQNGVKYDRICQLNVRTEHDLVGCIVQDVITEPAQKQLRLQGQNGYLEWAVNNPANHDSVSISKHGEKPREEMIGKKRPDDFRGEINHVGKILAGEKVDSPVSLERGLETMLVVAAAHSSAQKRRSVNICYDVGYNSRAII